MSHLQTEKDLPPATTVSAVGEKAGRACDGCLCRRARWYCVADGAFLCQPCDSSVHSANPLARRHERVRVKGSAGGERDSIAPKWHYGFKRKARTPRRGQHGRLVVPEMETSAADEEDEVVEEEMLLYRAPVFDSDFSSPADARVPKSSPPQPKRGGVASSVTGGVDCVTSEAEMAEFSANMESLLGRVLDGAELFCLDELCRVDAKEVSGRPVEVGRDGRLDNEMVADLSRETLDLDFGCGSRATVEEEKKPDAAAEWRKELPNGLALRLNYDAVVAAWSARGRSPWTSGERPLLRLEEFWLEFAGMWGSCGGGHGGGVVVGGGIQVTGMEREARVSRYREKRRTRLFSKKIRYEVRKLNAEKRPRMKGRFVKKTSSASPTVPDASDGGGLRFSD